MGGHEGGSEGSWAAPALGVQAQRRGRGEKVGRSPRPALITGVRTGLQHELLTHMRDGAGAWRRV